MEISKGEDACLFVCEKDRYRIEESRADMTIDDRYSTYSTNVNDRMCVCVLEKTVRTVVMITWSDEEFFLFSTEYTGHIIRGKLWGLLSGRQSGNIVSCVCRGQ